MAKQFREDNERQNKPTSLVRCEVVTLNFPDFKSSRQPQLTDTELQRIRAMLEAFDKIKSACPVAQRALL